MRFLHEQFFNVPSDCAWLRETALKHLETPPFQSFTLYGNVDSPARIDLYAKFRPNHDDHPIAVYSINNESGDLLLDVKEAA